MIIDIYAKYFVTFIDTSSYKDSDGDFRNITQTSNKTLSANELIDWVNELCKDEYFSTLQIDLDKFIISRFNSFTGDSQTITISFKRV